MRVYEQKVSFWILFDGKVSFFKIRDFEIWI